MGLIIIGIILIFLAIIFNIMRNKFNKNDWCIIISFVLYFLAMVEMVATMVNILKCQIPKQKDYETAVYEKQVLEYRLEHQDESLVGNELLYSDIVEFNKKLRDAKRYSGNFWIGWCFNDKIAQIEYITIDGIENFGD